MNAKVAILLILIALLFIPIVAGEQTPINLKIEKNKDILLADGADQCNH